MKLRLNTQLNPRVVEPEIPTLIADLENLASTEGISHQIYAGVLATFGKLSATLRDNVLRTIGSLKVRSELKHYNDIHGHKIKFIGKQQPSVLANIVVDKPLDMHVGYMDAADRIAQLYDALVLVPLFKKIETTLVKLNHSLSRGNVEQATEQVLALVQLTTPSAQLDELVVNVLRDIRNKQVPVTDVERIALIESIAKDELAAFARRAVVMQNDIYDENPDPKQRRPVQFKHVFANGKDYLAVNAKLLDMEYRLTEAKQLNDGLDTIDKQLAAIGEFVGTDAVPDAIARLLATAVRNMAMRMQQFSFAIGIQLKLEHNFVLSTIKLWTAINQGE